MFTVLFFCTSLSADTESNPPQNKVVDQKKTIQLTGIILDRAFSYFFAGDYDKSAIHFERYTHLEGDHESPLRFLGQIYAAQGDMKRSIDRLERATRAAPASIESHLLLAEAYLKVNQPGNAIKALDKVLEIDEFNARALHFQAFLHQQKNDLRKAASFYKRLIISARNGAGSEQFLEQAYTFLGNYYYQNQDFAKSIANYENLVKVNDENPRSLLVLGELYKITGQFKKSLNTMNRLLKKTPRNTSAMESRAETLYMMRHIKTRESLEELKNLSKKENPLLDAFLLEIQGKHNESQKTLDKFLQKSPSRLSARICQFRNLKAMAGSAQKPEDKYQLTIGARNEAYTVMTLAQRIGANNLALEYTEPVFEVIKSQSTELQFNKIFYLDELQQEFPDKIEQLAIDHMEFYGSHSVTLEHLGRAKGALAYRRQALRYANRLKDWYKFQNNEKRIKDIDSKIYANMAAYAWLLQSAPIGQPHKALRVANESVKIMPHMPNAKFITGIIYYTSSNKKVQNYEKSRSEFASAIQLARERSSNHSAPANFHFYHGMALEKIGNWEAAEKELQTAIQLDPYNATYLNYLGYMYSLRNKNLPKARELLLQALEDDPESEAYLDSYGWILFQMGKPREALHRLLQAYHEAGRKEIKDSVIYYHLAETYYALKDNELAEHYYKKTLDYIDKASEPLDRKKIKNKLYQLKRKRKTDKNK